MEKLYRTRKAEDGVVIRVPPGTPTGEYYDVVRDSKTGTIVAYPVTRKPRETINIG
jgi:hypothetical protein